MVFTLCLEMMWSGAHNESVRKVFLLRLLIVVLFSPKKTVELRLRGVEH